MKQERQKQSLPEPVARIKIIEHKEMDPKDKTEKSQLIGNVEVIQVAEPMPVVSEPEGHTGVSSRPERAPMVIRVLTGDTRLDRETDERVIKRERIGDVVLERVVAGMPA